MKKLTVILAILTPIHLTPPVQKSARIKGIQFRALSLKWKLPNRRSSCITEQPHGFWIRLWRTGWNRWHGSSFTSRLTTKRRSRSAADTESLLYWKSARRILSMTEMSCTAHPMAFGKRDMFHRFISQSAIQNNLFRQSSRQIACVAFLSRNLPWWFFRCFLFTIIL